MRICSNCGSTNAEVDGPICRKCGALLPLSSKPLRMRVPSTSKEKAPSNDNTIQNIPPESNEVQFFIPGIRTSQKPARLKLNEIPLGDNTLSSLSKIPSEVPPPVIHPNSTTVRTDNQGTASHPLEVKKVKKEFLQEIKPQPFRGAIRTSYDPPLTQPKESILVKHAQETSSTRDTIESQSLGVSQVTPPNQGSKSDSTPMKWKQLEKDMSDVLKVLSEKLSLPEEDSSKSNLTLSKGPEIRIIPTSLNEILDNLLQINVHIEASAIIKRDGTILASAISSRVSDSLFATIGSNLTMIGTDIINGLSAGKLKTISIHGTLGVLDLAPLDHENPQVKDMIIILFSNSKVKSGVISLCKNMVKKQILEYIGIEKKE